MTSQDTGPLADESNLVEKLSTVAASLYQETSPKDTSCKTAEYAALRRELVHYDRTCLTLLSLLLVLSTTVYGLVAQKDLFLLLALLSIAWFVGFCFIVDKRICILIIALYMQLHFEVPSKGFFWETWLRSGGLRLPFDQAKGAQIENSLSELQDINPVNIEFVLLFFTLLINAVWFCWVCVFSNHAQPRYAFYGHYTIEPLSCIYIIVSVWFFFHSCRFRHEYLSFNTVKNKTKFIEQYEKSRRMVANSWEI